VRSKASVTLFDGGEWARFSHYEQSDLNFHFLRRVLSQLQQRAPGQSISPEILPPPRGLDPRLVAWRGGVVWTRLDSMQDVWIRRDEWDELGMRSWKMRAM
jgi:actin-related protein 8